MTFLGDLVTRSVENPSHPLTSDALLEVLGGARTTSGLSMTPEKAMRMGVVYRNVQIIASTGGGLPLHVYRHGNRDLVRSSVITKDRSATSIARWETAIAHMATWGAACIFKHRDSRGNIRSLTPIHPTRVMVQSRETRNPEQPYRREFTIDGKTGYTDYELMYVPFLSMDGVKGVGPIGWARETAGSAMAAEQAAGKMFRNGMLLDGILTTEKLVSQKQATRLKRRWRSMAQGVDNAHDIAVLDQGAKFEPIAMPAKDAQFIEMRKFSRSELCGLFGNPGWMLNDQEKSTSWGTGMEQQFNTWVMITLSAYLKRLEQAINLEVLPESQYAEFKVEGLLRGDSKARAAFYASGIQHGWLVPNDVRPLENMNPVPWGDEPYRPFNESAASQADDDTSEEDAHGDES